MKFFLWRLFSFCSVMLLWSCGYPEAVCPNGVVEKDEACDDGNLTNGDNCDRNCTISACGNGIIANAEECDDGNLLDGDGCSSLLCIVEVGFDCDNDAPSNCKAICGDGRTLGDEGCDDGNLINGDACNDKCKAEDDFLCTGDPSVCTGKDCGSPPDTSPNLVPSALLQFCDLSNQDLSGADLSGANLSGANLSGANLSGAALFDLLGCPATLPGGFQCIFSPANSLFAIVGPEVNLTNANLANANLSSANLTNAFLFDANLSGANLIGANLTNANLTNANLTDANLVGATLSGANLSGTTLIGSNLFGAVLNGTNLANARVFNLLGCPAVLPPRVVLPKDPVLLRDFLCIQTPINSRFAILGPGVNLSFADLSFADLGFADLTGTFLNNAILTNADLTSTFLNNAILTNANLGGANLTDTELFSANLTDAELFGAKTGNVLGCQATLPNASFQCRPTPANSHFALVGPNVDLREANLIDINLTDVDLAEAFLNNATLTNANLTRTNLTRTNLIGATGQPSNADLANYNSTLCPNGVSSDSNAAGNTCVGQGF